MIDLIAKIAFACSAITATIGLVEWFLSEQQKQVVQNLALGIWNSIDDVKRGRIELDVRSQTPQLILGILSLTASVAFMSAFYADKRDTDPAVFWTFIVSLLASIVLILKWLLPNLQKFILSNRGIENYAWTLFRLWLGTMAVYFLWMLVATQAFMNEDGTARLVGVFLDVMVLTGRNTVIAFIYLIILANLSFLVWPPVVAGEIVTRQIAESPKGSLMAIAGLSSAVGAFLKLFVA